MNAKIANGSVRTVATAASLVAAPSAKGPAERLRRSPLWIANANAASSVAMSNLRGLHTFTRLPHDSACVTQRRHSLPRNLLLVSRSGIACFRYRAPSIWQMLF